jgi:ribosomal protein L32
LKYALIIFVLAFVAFLVYWRLRPYIRGVRRFLGVLREVRGMGAGAPPPASRPDARRSTSAQSVEKLTRCANCGTWVPSSRAVARAYCTHACLERAAS